MNKAKCDEQDYIHFLVAAHKVFSSVEAAATHPEGEGIVAHDAYTRLLQRLPPDSNGLWAEVEGCIALERGMLIIDDSTLDKPYASQMALVTNHWSGKQHQVVRGINLISLVWTDDGQSSLPCDYRIYNKANDGLDKNDHVREMLEVAHARGFSPALVAFDGWYSSLDNLKRIREYGWEWLTRLKSNRKVSQTAGQTRSVADIDIPTQGCVLHLTGYGLVKVFRTVDRHGNAEHWATSNLRMTDLERQTAAQNAWAIETYHRNLKQFTGVERAQFRLEVSQRNHIGLAIRAFLRLESHRIHQLVPFYDAKQSIIRQAIRLYLLNPSVVLSSTA
jgi:putative transposase